MSHQAECRLCDWRGGVHVSDDTAESELFAHEAEQAHARKIANIVRVLSDPTDKGAQRVACALCGTITERLVGGATSRLAAHENGPEHQQRYTEIAGIVELDEEAPAAPPVPELPPPLPAPPRERPPALTPVAINPPAPDAPLTPRPSRRPLYIVAGGAVVVVAAALVVARDGNDTQLANTAQLAPPPTASSPVAAEPTPSAEAAVIATAASVPALVAASLPVADAPATPAPAPAPPPAATPAATPFPISTVISPGIADVPRIAGAQLVDAYLDVYLLYQDGLPVAEATLRVEPAGVDVRTDRYGRTAIPVRTVGTHDLAVRTSSGVYTVKVWAPAELRTLVTSRLPVTAPAGAIKPAAPTPCASAIPGGWFWRGYNYPATDSNAVLRVVARPGTVVEVGGADSHSALTAGSCGLEAGPGAPARVVVGESGSAWFQGLPSGTYSVRLSRPGFEGTAAVSILGRTDAFTVTGN